MATKRAATQDFVPIRDVRNNVVVLKNGQICTILIASSINFALKSLDEQRAILQQFQSFLNTIDFSLQFYTQSRRLDIEPYLQKLMGREAQQDNDLMRIQLREYIQFIRTFVTEVDVMSKNFFVVIPYTPMQVDLKSNLGSIFTGRKPAAAVEDAKLQENLMQLQQRVSLVEQGLNRIGVRPIALKNEELVELYYHIFNPLEAKSKAPQQS
jgi:type IV secretory pathway VirB4 component